MKLLLFSTLFIGWMSFYFCQRTLPSTVANLVSAQDSASRGEGAMQTALSATYLGQLQSLFAVSYSISFLISGIMSDSVNVRVLLPACLATSGLLLAVFPWTEGNQMMGLVVYFLVGSLLGCGWPLTAKILKQTYRPSDLGVPWGIMSTASSFATLFSPVLVSTIIAGSGSWKYGFYIFGAIAVSLSLPIAFVTTLPSTDHPIDSGRIEKGGEGKQHSSSGVKWFHVFLVRELWGVIIIHSLMWLVKASIQDWGQLYLIQEGGFDTIRAGKCMKGVAGVGDCAAWLWCLHHDQSSG
jgi:OPA family sugar phosphate sensor protein UhpC-like MFS transporter